MKVVQDKNGVVFYFDDDMRISVLNPSLPWEKRYTLTMINKLNRANCKVNSLLSIPWVIEDMKRDYPWVTEEVHNFMAKGKIAKFFNFT